MLQLSMGHKPGRPLVPPIDDQHWAFIKWCWSAILERPLAGEVVSSLQQFLDTFPPPATLRDLLDSPTSSFNVPIYPRNDGPDHAMQIHSPPDRSQSRNAMDSRGSASPSTLENITQGPDVPASSPDHTPRSLPQALTVYTQHLTENTRHRALIVASPDSSECA